MLLTPAHSPTSAARDPAWPGRLQLALLFVAVTLPAAWLAEFNPAVFLDPSSLDAAGNFLQTIGRGLFDVQYTWIVNVALVPALIFCLLGYFGQVRLVIMSVVAIGTFRLWWVARRVRAPGARPRGRRSPGSW